MWKAIGGKRRMWLVILLIAAAILIAGCTAAFLYIQSRLNRIDRNSPVETVRPEEEYFETDENTEAAQEDGEYRKNKSGGYPMACGCGYHEGQGYPEYYVDRSGQEARGVQGAFGFHDDSHYQ